MVICLAATISGRVEASADQHPIIAFYQSNPQVQRNYHDTSRFLHSDYNIEINGSWEQISRLSQWLDEIYQVPIGRETLDAIFSSANALRLHHSPSALIASGRTRASISSNLTNGNGMDVDVYFDARIPDSGSHTVFNRYRQPIEFNALHNLFHELVHARHLTNGTWRYFDSEAQAIEEENIFRQQLGDARGESNIALRVGKRGMQIWRPDEGM